MKFFVESAGSDIQLRTGNTQNTTQTRYRCAHFLVRELEMKEITKIIEGRKREESDRVEFHIERLLNILPLLQKARIAQSV
jgi:hypothetical protein